MALVNVTAFGEVDVEGKIKLSDYARKRMNNDVLKFKGKAIEIIIKQRGKRGVQMNSYVWGVVYKMLQMELNELGNDFTIDDIHEWCKQEFNSINIIGEGGEVIGKKGSSTAALNNSEHIEYWMKIREWSLDFLKLYIPLPKEDLTLKF